MTSQTCSKKGNCNCHSNQKGNKNLELFIPDHCPDKWSVAKFFAETYHGHLTFKAGNKRLDTESGMHLECIAGAERYHSGVPNHFRVKLKKLNEQEWWYGRWSVDERRAVFCNCDELGLEYFFMFAHNYVNGKILSQAHIGHVIKGIIDSGCMRFSRTIAPLNEMMISFARLLKIQGGIKYDAGFGALVDQIKDMVKLLGSERPNHHCRLDIVQLHKDLQKMADEYEFAFIP